MLDVADPPRPTTFPSAAPRWCMHGGLIAAAAVAIVVLIQLWAGSYHSERGLYSDESAHFMNGLVIRDYLREGLGQAPIAFAHEYYQHYPKIAPFMWPPLFHGVLGLFLLPGWPPMPAAIVLLGLFTSWIAWRLYFVVASFASVPVAIGAVLFFLVTPSVIELSSSVMVDIVVAAFAFEAAVWLGRYSHTTSPRAAAVFGAMTALACVAKGNGLSAVVAPFALIALTSNYHLLRTRGLYVAATIVVLVAAPPLYLAYQLDAPLGDFGPLSWPLVASRVAFYAQHVWTQLGSITLLLAGVGGAAVVWRRAWIDEPSRHLAAALGAMTIGAFVFHVVSPHTLSNGRYVTLAMAPILGLAALGMMALTRGIAERRLRWTVQLIAFGLIAATQVTSHVTHVAQQPLGYRDATRFLDSAHGLAGRRVLIVSDEFGEGAAVAEVAALGRLPRPVVLRGSKVLANDDWMGNHFAIRYASPDVLLRDLEAMHVDYVVLDRSVHARGLSYWQNTEAAMTSAPNRAHLLAQTPVDERKGPSRSLAIYHLAIPAPGTPKAVELSGTADQAFRRLRGIR